INVQVWRWSGSRSAKRRGQVLPSRLGEFHPEPLTEPDVSLSTYPARTNARRLPPSIDQRGSSRCRLTRANGDDLPPSIRERYPASSLLRGSPRLTGASVLSASWL